MAFTILQLVVANWPGGQSTEFLEESGEHEPGFQEWNSLLRVPWKDQVHFLCLFSGLTIQDYSMHTAASPACPCSLPLSPHASLSCHFST